MLIGGLDIGTTGCKLTVYNDLGEFISNEYQEYEVSRKKGAHEIEAGVIFDAVLKVIKETVKKQPEISAIGVTTFGETFVMLDENDKPLLNAMLYTDPRGGEEVEALKEKLSEDKLISICGVKPHSMYALPKIMWIKNNYPEKYESAKHILLMEDYIVYMLSGVAQIDYSLAARTMALDIKKREWSRQIYDAAGIDVSKMSKLVAPGTVAGEMKASLKEKLGIKHDIKIVNGAHDQVAAAVGAGVFYAGQAVIGSGTVECFTPVFDKVPENKELYDYGYSVVPFIFDNTYVCYAFSFTGGAVLKWHRDNFAKLEAECAKKEGKNVYAELDAKIPEKPTDILVLPHFAGAATPFMDNGAKASMVGLTLEHTTEDIYKALMEGVAYELNLNVQNLYEAGIRPEKIVNTGGGASSPKWIQIKADMIDHEITALDALEAGTCGTCMLVLTAMGAYESLEEAKKFFVKPKKTYAPNEEASKIYSKNFKAYKKLYQALRPITREVYDE